MLGMEEGEASLRMEKASGTLLLRNGSGGGGSNSIQGGRVGGDDIGGRFDNGTICDLIEDDEETEEDDVVESFEFILQALSFRDSFACSFNKVPLSSLYKFKCTSSRCFLMFVENMEQITHCNGLSTCGINFREVSK